MRKIFLGLAALGVAAAPLGAHAASTKQRSMQGDETMQQGRMQGQDGTSARGQSSGVKTGMLRCDVGGGAGFVVGSKREVACTYKAAGMKAQRYMGSIDRFGLDIGVTGKSVMVWNVVAPSTDAKGQTLDGKYSGVSGGVAAGVGASANVLVSSSSGFNLQPVSVEGQKGVNLAAGVGTLNLRSADRG